MIREASPKGAVTVQEHVEFDKSRQARFLPT